MSQSPIKVGIIGAGGVSQVVHIPTLNYMSEFFTITYLCDVSRSALEFCSKRVVNHIPATTVDASELCRSPDVELVFVANSDEFHVRHAVLALENDKHVFIEKPMAMTEQGANAIIEAEAKSKGHVMVGYMRRYALAFTEAVKEIGGLDKIMYARVQDIIGPNSVFVGQSATFSKEFTDHQDEDVKEMEALAAEIAQQGLGEECKVQPTPSFIRQYRILGNLGSHDLSAMREALGMPSGVLGVSLGPPFWSVLFQYPGFTVTYESGLHNIPVFDAHIEVYGQSKSIRIDYDTPFIKGLPITMTIRENVDGALKETTVRKTYEDAYTLEMRELYGLVREDKPVKTTAEDAKQDLIIYRMIMQAAAKSLSAS